MVLKTYTGEHTPVVGQMEVKVKYGSQRQMLRLVVVACHGTLLQGMHHVQCYIDDILITKEECGGSVETSATSWYPSEMQQVCFPPGVS